MIYSIILGPKDEGGGSGVEPASRKESLSRGRAGRALAGRTPKNARQN